MDFEIKEEPLYDTQFQLESDEFIAHNGNGKSESCDFCVEIFDTKSQKNRHIFEHFTHEICTDCDQRLIRIGASLFVLHTRMTCVKADNDTSAIHSTLTYSKLKEQPDDFDNVKSPLCIELDADLSEQLLIKEQKEDSTSLENFNPFGNDDNDDGDEFADKHETTQQNDSITSENAFKHKKQTNRSSKRNHMRLSHAKQLKKNDDSLLELSWKEKRKLINDRYYGHLIECSVDGCNEKIARKRMQSHLAKVHGVQYECKVAECRAILSTKESFQAHMQRHDPVRERIKCGNCSNTFANKNSLKSHEKLIHLKTAKSHVCVECGLRFKSKCFLKEHSFLHTGEKPFNCSCGKTFRTKRLISIHERAVHRGIKPFKCTQADCSKAYAYDVDLKRHLFSAHSIWPKKLPCLICDRIFPEPKLLRKHMESHNVQN